MKEKIASVIDALSDGFEREAELKYGENIQKIIEEHNFLDIKDPEEFSSLIFSAFERQIDILARLATAHYKVEGDKLDKLKFVYTNYTFIDSHLESLIYKYEGGACVSDKSRWLISAYIKYLVSDEILEITKREYWYPKLKDTTKWIHWIESMETLHYASSFEYFNLKESITSDYKTMIENKLTVLEDSFASDIHFAKKVPLEHNKICYEFQDAKNKDLGHIIVDEIGQISWRFFYSGDKQKRAKYNDVKPKWFEDLLGLDN